MSISTIEPTACVGNSLEIINDNFSYISDVLDGLITDVASSGIDIDMDGTSALFSVRLKSGGGLQFDGGEIELSPFNFVEGNGIDISVTDTTANFSTKIDTASGLGFDSGNMIVKLKPSGGLEFDGGEIKLTPSASKSFNLAIRPSDPDSSDDINIDRFSDSDDDPNVMVPYFKTVEGAVSFARANISGNTTIYVDEDCWYSINPITKGGLKAEFVDTDRLPLSGDFEPGVYVWNKDYATPATKLYGSCSFDTFTHSPYIVRLKSRYNQTGLNRYITTRRFTDPPRKVKINVFYCSDPTVGGGDEDPFDFGPLSSFDTWINHLPKKKANGDDSDLYDTVENQSFNLVGDMELKDICFEYKTNANACFGLNFYNATVNVSNCGVLLDGPGYYPYSLIRSEKSSIDYLGEILYDPVLSLTSTESFPVSAAIYPGYALAVQAENTYHSDYVNCSSIFTYRDSTMENLDAQVRNFGKRSQLRTSFILSGKLNVYTGALVNVLGQSTIYDSNHYFQDSLDIVAKEVSASTLSSYGSPKDMFLYEFKKLTSMRVGGIDNHEWSLSTTVGDPMYLPVFAIDLGVGNLYSVSAFDVYGVAPNEHPVAIIEPFLVYASELSLSTQLYLDSLVTAISEEYVITTDTLCSVGSPDNVYNLGGYQLQYI